LFFKVIGITRMSQPQKILMAVSDMQVTLPQHQIGCTANLAKVKTGALSVAFDLPTQTGYDWRSYFGPKAVGKVGVPVNRLGDMRAASDIPPTR
jgi:methylmalonyl-CoA mutase N-terminal domain/subunit